MYLPNPGRGQASWSEAALRVASRRAKFIPPLEAEGFLWLFCNDRNQIFEKIIFLYFNVSST